MDMNIPDIRKWHVGEVTITRIKELGTLVIPPFGMLKAGFDDIKSHGWLAPHYATPDGFLKVHIQSFVIEVAGKTILVDTGVGNGKVREMVPHLNMLETPFLANLRAAGFAPEAIDIVFCTHLHQDHVGWNTTKSDGRWVPTFPNARYLFGQTEFDFARELAEEDGRVWTDSILPVAEAGLVDFIDETFEIAPGITLDLTPGHSGGHLSVWVSSQGKTAVITGDVIQHPAQAAMPNVCSNYCAEPDLARLSRRDFLARVSDRGAIMLGSHFADPVGVYVQAADDGWIFETVGV